MTEKRTYCCFIISNCLKMVNINVYRKTNIVITTPMITKMHVDITIPTVIGRLLDEDTELICFTLSRKKGYKIFFWNRMYCVYVKCSNRKKYDCTLPVCITVFTYLCHMLSLLYNHTDNSRWFCHMSGWYSEHRNYTGNYLHRTTCILNIYCTLISSYIMNAWLFLLIIFHVA